MEGVKRFHNPIEDLVGGKSVQYVDFPMHGNIGDLLIAQGTLEFLRKINANVTQIAASYNYNPRWLGSDEVLLMHGGGNFGDLYPRFQLFRERCVKELADNRIIILPQSIHFESQENFRRCKEIMG